jgi:hypothetical protein
MYAICISRTRCFVKYSDRTLKIFRISIPKLSKLTQEYYQCHVCVDCQIEDVVHNEWEICIELKTCKNTLATVKIVMQMVTFDF